MFLLTVAIVKLSELFIWPVDTSWFIGFNILHFELENGSDKVKHAKKKSKLLLLGFKH